MAKVRERVAQFTHIFMKGILEGKNRACKSGQVQMFERSAAQFSKDANEAVRRWGKKIREGLEELRSMFENRKSRRENGEGKSISSKNSKSQ